MAPTVTLTRTDPNPRRFDAVISSISSDIGCGSVTKCHAASPGHFQSFDRNRYPTSCDTTAMSDTWGSEWDAVADVVVVGSGAAGGSAALTAAHDGASVIVLEKGSFVGGTTGKSGGVFWVPNNPVMVAAAIVDDRTDALRYLARTAYPVDYSPDSPTLGLSQRSFELLEAFYDQGQPAVRSFVDAGAFTLEQVEYPDYFADLPENKTPRGRTMQPAFPEGWRRGVDPSGGQLLAESLLNAAERYGAEVRLDHQVVHVVQDDDGRVIGVEARTGVRTVLIGARRGVVFASGGFLHDRDMAKQFLRGPVLGGGAVDTATGDFVRIGVEVGAQLGNMSHAWWDQVVVEHVITVPSTLRDVYSAHGDAMIMVNRHGKRVVNEKAVYNERGQAHFTWDPTRCEYPNLLMFWIWDESVVQIDEPSRFRWPVPLPGQEPLPFVIKAPDLASLADELRVRLERLASHTGNVQLSPEFDAQLAATIDRFNEMAAAGRDLDFGRGESQIEKTWAGSARPGASSPSMYPLSASGPYYAVILGPGALDTKGGPIIDASARVLTVDNAVIPGLYGAGNCVASPAGQAYWGPGGTIGPAMVFGYIAAKSALAMT